jgi:hypothetical protein
MVLPIIDKQRIAELREVLSKIDPAGHQIWILEVYALYDGVDRLRARVDIKTGELLPCQQKGLSAAHVSQGGKDDA